MRKYVFYLFFPIAMALIAGCVSSTPKALRLAMDERVRTGRSAIREATISRTAEEMEAIAKQYPELLTSEFKKRLEQQLRIARIAVGEAATKGTLEEMEIIANQCPSLLTPQFEDRISELYIQKTIESVREARTISVHVKNNSIGEQGKMFEPFIAHQLSRLLKTAGLTVVTQNSDIVLSLEFEAGARGAYWSPGGSPLNGPRWFYSGAYASGTIGVGDRTNKYYFRFNYSGDDLRDRDFGLLPTDPKDAPFGMAFIKADVPEKLVYLVALGRGNAWTGNLRRAAWLISGKTSVPPERMTYDHEKIQEQVTAAQSEQLPTPSHWRVFGSRFGEYSLAERRLRHDRY